MKVKSIKSKVRKKKARLSSARKKLKFRIQMRMIKFTSALYEEMNIRNKNNPNKLNKIYKDLELEIVGNREFTD